jgi:hypothetical protein
LNKAGRVGRRPRTFTRDGTTAAEAEARAVNAEQWEPMPGMVKRQCPRCRYFFAAPATAPPRPHCPDCVQELAAEQRREESQG